MIIEFFITFSILIVVLISYIFIDSAQRREFKESFSAIAIGASEVQFNKKDRVLSGWKNVHLDFDDTQDIKNILYSITMYDNDPVADNDKCDRALTINNVGSKAVMIMRKNYFGYENGMLLKDFGKKFTDFNFDAFDCIVSKKYFSFIYSNNNFFNYLSRRNFIFRAWKNSGSNIYNKSSWYSSDYSQVGSNFSRDCLFSLKPIQTCSLQSVMLKNNIEFVLKSVMSAAELFQKTGCAAEAALTSNLACPLFTNFQRGLYLVSFYRFQKYILFQQLQEKKLFVLKTALVK